MTKTPSERTRPRIRNTGPSYLRSTDDRGHSETITCRVAPDVTEIMGEIVASRALPDITTIGCLNRYLLFTEESLNTVVQKVAIGKITTLWGQFQIVDKILEQEQLLTAQQRQMDTLQQLEFSCRNKEDIQHFAELVQKIYNQSLAIPDPYWRDKSVKVLEGRYGKYLKVMKRRKVSTGRIVEVDDERSEE